MTSYLTDSNYFDVSDVVEYMTTVVPTGLLAIWDVTFETFNSIDEFQFKILRALIIILCINLAFIWITWNRYGEKITERFMKAASSKSLEDLKREATELKLPKEHTPRI